MSPHLTVVGQDLIFHILAISVIVVAILFCAAELLLCHCFSKDQRKVTRNREEEDQTSLSVPGRAIPSVQHVSHIQVRPPVPLKRLIPHTSTPGPPRTPRTQRDEATIQQPSGPTEELSVKQVTLVKRGPPVPRKPKPKFASPSGNPTHNTRLANPRMDMSLTVNFDEEDHQEVSGLHNDTRLTSNSPQYDFNIDNKPEPKRSHWDSYIEPEEIFPLDLALFKADLRYEQENEFRKAKERQADAIRRDRQRELGPKKKKR